MRTNQQGDFIRGGCPSHSKLNTVVTAAVFIIVGLLFLGRNFGIIDSDLFGILVSWQMLLIVVGVVNLIKRHFFGGVITIAIGAYFLLPEISWVEGEWLDMFWPVLFIFVGIMILFKPERHHFNAHWDGRRPEYTKEVYGSEDGFIVSDNTFGSVQQIVLDPVFRGARLRNAFGGTVLDLRRSKLEAPQTFDGDYPVGCGLDDVFMAPVLLWRRGDMDSLPGWIGLCRIIGCRRFPVRIC